MGMKDLEDMLVAVTIATEVPPRPISRADMPTFTPEMRDMAIKAVADVIRNRVKSENFPETATEVVMQDWAFSAVCKEDYWRKALAGKWFLGHVHVCYGIWLQPECYEGFTEGATHYYSPISMKPQYSEPRWWDQVTEIVIPGLTGDYFKFGRLAA